MTTITPEQRQAVAEAGNAPVELTDRQTGDTFVLIRAEVFARMRARWDDEEDRREREAWAGLAGKAREQWSRENPY